MIRLFGVTAAVVAAVALAGCTSSPPSASSTSPSAPSSSTSVPAATPSVTVTPVSSGPTSATKAKACPFADKTFLADTVGMRLARVEVLRSSGATVGCRVYALQGSSLASSERLPGPNQPAVEIVVQRYGSATDAHNAVVLTARKGTNPQSLSLGNGNDAACYQTGFDPKDHGTDWACAASSGTRSAFVRTVVTSPALDAAQVVKRVLSSL